MRTALLAALAALSLTAMGCLAQVRGGYGVPLNQPAGRGGPRLDAQAHAGPLGVALRSMLRHDGTAQLAFGLETSQDLELGPRTRFSVREGIHALQFDFGDPDGFSFASPYVELLFVLEGRGPGRRPVLTVGPGLLYDFGLFGRVPHELIFTVSVGVGFYGTPWEG